MDYVVVPLGDGRLKLVSPAGEESFADLKRGVSYARKAGVHHNVINANTFEYAFVEIELKSWKYTPWPELRRRRAGPSPLGEKVPVVSKTRLRHDGRMRGPSPAPK